MTLIDLDDDRNCFCGMDGEYEKYNIDPDVINDAIHTMWEPPACKHCSNNPRNGGSGICHCTLGTPTIT